MEKTSEIIAGVQCHIYQNGSGGPALYWGTAAQEGRETVVKILRELRPGAVFTLVCFEAEDWNRDFSPWAADGVRPGEAFTGGGAATLAWLTGACVPYIEEKFGKPAARMIGGYSLAGLFALWAFYESGLFTGCASCSGSLWFPGWTDYVNRKKAPEGSRVYLSLGAKEEKTRNAAMAAVGDMTRRMHDILTADGNVTRTELVWHPGGHFADVERRIAQGFAWLLGGV